MTILELALQIITFGLALWLGLYLISRNPADGRLLLAGLGLAAYAIGLALNLLAGFAPDGQLADLLAAWQRPFLTLPALLWLLLLIRLARDERPWRDRWRRQPRSVGVVLAATIFFGLGFSFILFSVDWLPRLWLVSGIGVDLLLLGTAVAFFDAFDEGETLLPHFLRAFDYALLTVLIFGGQVALVMVFSSGVTFPMLLLLLTTVTAAITVQAFADTAQNLADQIAFRSSPQIRQQRLELRTAADAVQRVDSRLNLAALDEAEFTRLTRRALSHMGNLPRLAASPLTRLPLVENRLKAQGTMPDTLARAAELKRLLTESIDRLKPPGDAMFGLSDEWRHYNALYFPYVMGLKPYSRRVHDRKGETAVSQALNWFRSEVPQRTLYNWQNAAAELVAQDIREQDRLAHRP